MIYRQNDPPPLVFFKFFCSFLDRYANPPSRSRNVFRCHSDTCSEQQKDIFKTRKVAWRNDCAALLIRRRRVICSIERARSFEERPKCNCHLIWPLNRPHIFDHLYHHTIVYYRPSFFFNFYLTRSHPPVSASYIYPSQTLYINDDDDSHQAYSFPCKLDWVHISFILDKYL